MRRRELRNGPWFLGGRFHGNLNLSELLDFPVEKRKVPVLTNWPGVHFTARSSLAEVYSGVCKSTFRSRRGTDRTAKSL